MPKRCHLLLYGFGPYENFRSNVTAEFIDALRCPGWVATHVFDVRFDWHMFARIFHEKQPKIILGMGQHPRARKLRIECTARNLMAKSRGGSEIPIRKLGPAKHRATLALPETTLTTRTYDAGTYVCNYSMYAAASYGAANGAAFGFLHVPLALERSALLAYMRRIFSEFRP